MIHLLVFELNVVALRSLLIKVIDDAVLLGKIVHFHGNCCLASLSNLHFFLPSVDYDLIVIVGEWFALLSTALQNVRLDAMDKAIFTGILGKADASNLSLLAPNDLQDFQIAHVTFLVVCKNEYEGWIEIGQEASKVDEFVDFSSEYSTRCSARSALDIGRALRKG